MGVVPPLVGVAVNVILVPAQIAPDGLAVMLTLAANIGLTVIVIEFDVAGLPVKHGLALLVMIHVITLPFAKDDEEYVVFVAPPIFVPLFCH